MKRHRGLRPGRDEPAPHPPKPKIPKTKHVAVVSGMSLVLWKALFFPYLSLVELVQLSRTCKAMAGFDDLKKLIKIKRDAAFKGFHKRHWNKMGLKRSQSLDYLDDHPTKFILSKLGPRSGVTLVGAFSSKELLIRQVRQEIMDEGVLPFPLQGVSYGKKFIIRGLTIWGATFKDDIREIIREYEALQEAERQRKLFQGLPGASNPVSPLYNDGMPNIQDFI